MTVPASAETISTGYSEFTAYSLINLALGTDLESLWDKSGRCSSMSQESIVLSEVGPLSQIYPLPHLLRD